MKKKFDMERALAGDPCLTRAGLKAYIRHVETNEKAPYPVLGYIDRGEELLQNQAWTKGLKALPTETPHPADIVGMWGEKHTFDHWHLLRKDIKYIAKDRDGRWFGYTEEPVRSDSGIWITTQMGSTEDLRILSEEVLPKVQDWKFSLIKRTDNV